MSPPYGGCRRRTRSTRRCRPASTRAWSRRSRAAASPELYTHQAAAVSHALAGESVVVTTPTASGKTLCYNIPVLNAILTDSSTRALYLFPTKALAQDQLAELDRLAQVLNEAAGLDLGVFTYDGDTPQDARRAIRARAQVVLTNPDMLHSGILPHHPKWARLFENLRFIVIDELHAYRGVFGSHLANVLRRLRRICRHYGSDPVFVCSSATIANPKELAEGLTERPFELVEESGAPRGEKYFFFVNPPIVNKQLGIRRSYTQETRRVALEFLRRGLQIIVFAQSRLVTEILTRYLKDTVQGPPGADDVVRGYRGGYLPNRRREIEKGLRDGEVRAVVATSALELGIDIGALDVAVLAGYPGTIAATWQRAGRAGRRAGQSAAVLVASSAPLDQYVVRNPSYFFGASPEHALINPDNLQILLAHIKCAAFELPFGTTEVFGRESVQEILRILSEEGLVHLAEAQAPGEEAHWHWTSESYPADAISLRSISSDNFVIVDSTEPTRVIGETDFTSAPSIAPREGDLHRRRHALPGGAPRFREPQGVRAAGGLRLLHRRDPLRPRDDSRHVRNRSGVGPLVARRSPRRLARRRLQEDQVLHERERRLRRARPARAGDAHDRLLVHHPAAGHDRPALRRRRPAGRRDRPRVRRAPGGAAAPDVRPARRRRVDRERHRAGRAAGGGGERDGVRRASAGRRGTGRPRSHRQPGAGRLRRAAVFVYDNYPGGIGLSEPLFTMRHALLAKTRDLIASCPCESGCPSCVGPLGEVGPLAKTVALDILSADHLTAAGAEMDRAALAARIQDILKNRAKPVAASRGPAQEPRRRCRPTRSRRSPRGARPPKRLRASWRCSAAPWSPAIAGRR